MNKHYVCDFHVCAPFVKRRTGTSKLTPNCFLLNSSRVAIKSKGTCPVKASRSAVPRLSARTVVLVFASERYYTWDDAIPLSLRTGAHGQSD